MTNILLTNDDGIDAPGLAALTSAVSSLNEARCWTVAPLTDQSACSHAVTVRRPLRVERRGPGVYAVAGTAADCVVLAGNGLLPERPDLVVSGINGGPNLGDDVHYSATTAAAAEGALQGIPSLAVSLAWDFNDPERGRGWSAAACLTAWTLERLRSLAVPDCYLNLNVPDLPLHRVRGLRLCELGRRQFTTHVTTTPGAYARAADYMVFTTHQGHTANAVSDLAALSEGFATLTPVSVTPTHDAGLRKLRAFLSRPGHGWPGADSVLSTAVGRETGCPDGRKG